MPTLHLLFFIELLELATELKWRWKHSADADFLYKSMHDISVEVFNLKKKNVVIFGRRRGPLCKYFYF